ncbi:MAG TPA: metalloregulator ArsR/SmtB family transcription factor [Polyangia bacterium]|nr:metalloregulator ArsR/SmtB family transcription factor [Polyangia bacterium]
MRQANVREVRNARGSHEPLDLDDSGLMQALRALADPTRFRMVQEIAAAGELCCGDVKSLFDCSQPTVSHHLKVLHLAGLLSVRNAGKRRYTSVNRVMLSAVAAELPARLLPPRGRARARA